MNVTAPVPAPTAEALTASPTGIPWPLQSHLTLPAIPSAVPCTRMHTREQLARWQVSGDTGAAELVVCELVTNAVRAYPGWAQPVPYVRLWLSSDRDDVLVQVWDGADRMPVLQEPDQAATGGRGLLIVAALSKDWGWYRLAALPGKITWSLIAAES